MAKKNDTKIDGELNNKEKKDVKASDSKPKKGKSSSAAVSKKSKNGAFSRIGKYFKDLKSEFKKVVWPTKKQIFNNTLVVLVTMLIMGVFIFLLDTGLLKLLELLTS